MYFSAYKREVFVSKNGLGLRCNAPGVLRRFSFWVESHVLPREIDICRLALLSSLNNFDDHSTVSVLVRLSPDLTKFDFFQSENTFAPQKVNMARTKQVSPCRWIGFLRYGLVVDTTYTHHIFPLVIPFRPHVNPPEERLLVSSSPPRQLVSLHQPLVESKNPTVIALEPSLSVRFVVIRSPPTFSSASCHSNVWFVRLHRISNPIFDSKVPLFWPFRKQLKPTWLDSLKIPTCVPSTPSV